MSGTVNGTTTGANTIRLTGMATGMDTDNTVKQLMKSYQTQLDKLNQRRDLTQWTQDLYRDIIGDVNTFKSSFFDSVKTDSYMLSMETYSNYDINVLTPSAGVSVTANSGANVGTYSVDFSDVNGDGSNIKGHAATGAGITSKLSGVSLYSKLDALGINTTKITLTYNGISKDVDIDPANMTMKDLVNAINSKVPAVKASFSEISGNFSIQTVDTGASQTLSLTDATGGNILQKLNLTVNPLATSVDNSDAAHGIAPSDLSVRIIGPDGGFKIVSQASNTFSADGVIFNFVAGAKNTDITVAGNSQKTFDKIKGFIDKYNSLVDELSAKVNEKKQFTYLPLTSTQKEAMSDSDIKNWESKAKTGLLHGDSMLQGMLYSMRSALYTPVQGAGISLGDIGLSTSSDVSQNGKIIIDEAKLKNAIETKGDLVTKLFAQPSTTQASYDPNLSRDQRDIRNKEEGIFQRISDSLQDYTRITRDSAGHKGMLLEKAGIKGDFTEYSNSLTKDLLDQQTRIDAFTQRMNDKQEQYYIMFSKLETAMNQFNAQSSWLSQQLGGSGN